jgi:subtilisin family serine protease
MTKRIYMCFNYIPTIYILIIQLLPLTMVNDTNLSRRTVLIGTGTSIGVLTVGKGTGMSVPPRFVVGTRSKAAASKAKDRATEVIRELDFGPTGQAVVGRFGQDDREALRTHHGVRYVEPDIRVHAVGETLPWGVDRVDAEVVHSSGDTGSGADIAIIDTGIDKDHSDLQANVGTGDSFVDYTGSWNDDNGHGTHCAGIADAVDNSAGVIGVSTSATLHAAKVLDESGSGYASDVAAGITWVADQGYDVGSLSLGSRRSSSVIKDACTTAFRNGVLLIAAAGNEGPSKNSVGYPAAYQDCIAVSATDMNDTLPRWSSRGSEVELAAPGVNILSTYNDGGYTSLSGTSMACPHVSGAGGQLMANGYTNTEARQRLRETAEDIGLSSEEQGYGLLDVENAVLGTMTGDNLNGGSSGGGDSAPVVDSLTLAEDNTGKSPHADFDASWKVSDPDGDLSTVDITLTDSTEGGTEDSTTIDVSGDTATGTTTLRARHEENSGHTYQVKLVVTDSHGDTDSATADEIEDGS